MTGFKEQCFELRMKGHTLGEIARITGRPKTSVYAHIKKLPLSTEKWTRIRAAHGVHIRKFALAKKGKSNRPFHPFEWDEESVLMVAHFIFDGGIGHAGCSYNNRNEILLRRVEKLMTKIYKFEPTRYYNRLTGVSRISYFNVALSAYMKARAITLLRDIQKMKPALKVEFLRAFFDDEGCMDFRPARNHRCIRGYQKNVQILESVRAILADLGIDSKMQAPNEIVIAGKNNLLRFQGEINFSPAVCINGNRPNSIWRKSLEKRELLRRAIASYKPVGSNGVHRN